MGNTGSAHNLHNNYVGSELNSYTAQQCVRRTVEKGRKYQVVMGEWSNGKKIADYRVLPKPTENLKLRHTTNGAILQAGGTISFRDKEQVDLERKNEPVNFQPMRRSQTLILDVQNETTTEFCRSKTLLHVRYNKKKSQDNVIDNFESRLLLTGENTSTPSALMTNKYNKKCRAPPAPTKISTRNASTSTDHKLSSAERNSSWLAKPHIYRTNSNKASVPRKQLTTPAITKSIPFQKNSNTRISVTNSRPIDKISPPCFSKLPYRREKSFDAKLLRHRETDNCSDRKASKQIQRNLPISQNINESEDKLDRNLCDNNEKKILPRQLENFEGKKDSTAFPDTYRSETNYLRERYKTEKCVLQKEATPFNFHKDSKASDIEDSTVINERKKYLQSRIPRLKRTFYFGMETANKHFSPLQKLVCESEKKTQENVALYHNIEPEEEIIDCGILVHLRPTLPRRQHETPSFSPTAAWKNLMEEQQRLQLERSKLKKNISNSRIPESPVCLKSSTKNNYISASTNWTPQQDLEDDDDNEENDAEHQIYNAMKFPEKMEKEKENCTKALHIFSLSLPRDVHLQYVEQQNSLKAAYWLVPGFNSLQKIKTHLAKNTDLRPNAKCTCSSNTTCKHYNCQLQNNFGDPFGVESESTHQLNCDLNKSRHIIYKNDNWLLHKSKAADSSSLKPLNTVPLVNLQPKSLKNICGGKHIVYLPVKGTFKSIQDSQKNPKQTKMAKPTYTQKRQRQKQETTRQSLQDLTPIQYIHQSKVSATEKNLHRFSFQSTIRVLEKRRLAEKLSKDAEIQEAQRLNELEAMQRVEEDFQRKRAPEKANLRNQLRLHLEEYAENGEYRSLPLNMNKKDISRQHEQENQHISDTKNDIFCRAEPDGAVSPSLDFNYNITKVRHSNYNLSAAKCSKDLECFSFDGEESEGETPFPDLQSTAILTETYLHSVV